MHRTRSRRIAIVVIAAAVSVLVPGPHADAATAAGVELAFQKRLNSGRASISRPALVMHAGLRTVARSWSSSMAASNNLAHGNAGGRINSAAPDPYESNGAPDDGFAGWCENVAYNSVSQTATDDQVAQMFYNQFYNSTSGHKECMLSLSPTNFGQNVLGVGVVYDSADRRWWITVDIVKDNTVPNAWTRVEQTSTAVTYSGSWSATISNARASGGSYRRSGSQGSYARYTCTCTGVRWIGEQTPAGGIAEIRLDGVLVGTVDQYSGVTYWKRALFSRSGLPYGAHTLEVRVKGTRNPSSAGFYSYIDAFERLA